MENVGDHHQWTSMDMIIFEVFLNNIDLIPQQQI